MLITISHIKFRDLLLAWYQVHQRSLPWRNTTNPYKIWLSEIILQQTRVEQGLPYYKRFIAQYPSLTALAHATEQEILRLWQGLGYYSRARNLYHCTQTIVKKYGGIFPDNYKELLGLKGIGPYTAAAIAAISFKEVVAAVDGNVCRVLSRIFGLTYDIGTLKGRKGIHQLATTLVHPLQPDTYSQAIMDFGSLQCSPICPLCTTCVFKSYCIAFHSNKQKILPIKTNKINKKERYFDYLILKYKDILYMKKRIQDDIWENMYDFYLVENKKRLDLDQMNDSLLLMARKYNLIITTFKKESCHLLTHQKLFVKFHQIIITSNFLQKGGLLCSPFLLEPISIKEVENLPKPILIHNFLKEYFETILKLT